MTPQTVQTDQELKPIHNPLAHEAIPKDWTETEQIVAGFWIEVLKLDEINLEDDFFKLGGHSLLATQLITRIETRFGCRLQFKNVAVFSTVKQLAQAVDDLVAKGDNLFKTKINKAPNAEYYPLSNAQTRLWILDQLEEESTSYNLPSALILKGEIDIHKFEDALLQLIQRHESLRTTFEMIAGKTVQIIHDNAEISIVKSVGQADKLAEKISEFIHPFDLSQAPLLRVEFCKYDADEYLFMFDIHHIISDGISQDLLISDFMNLYQGKTLPQLALQYRDYAVWQNELFASDEMNVQAEYWVDRFSDELPVLNLPYDFKRPLNQSFKGSTTQYEMSEKNTTDLKVLARKIGVTPYMMLLGIYNILLSKYSGQEDIIVGSPIAGRSHELLEPILGMFVNTLAMRNFPNGNKSFLEFIEEIKRSATEAYANQDYPFESLIDQLNLERDMGRTPLFDTMFSFQSSFNTDESGTVVNEQFSMKPYEFVGETAKFDMVLEVFDHVAAFNLKMEYCVDLFKADTIKNFFEQYENIIEQITSNPNILLSEISVLNEEDIKAVTVDVNATAQSFKIEQPINFSLELAATKYKNQPALEFEGQTLTYAELNARANQIANTLIAQGALKGDIISVISTPSLEMIIGTWGVIKSGATLLPIDPKYPVNRIEYILKESESKIVLTDQLEIDLGKCTSQILNLSASAEWLEDDSNPNVKNALDDVAYVIFTSGSTGQPKGVEVKHQALLNFCHWHVNECDITSDDHCTKYAGLGLMLQY